MADPGWLGWHGGSRHRVWIMPPFPCGWISLARALLFVDTLHPVHEGRLFRWGFGPTESPVYDYGRTDPEALAASGSKPRDVRDARRWRDSPHYKMIQTGDTFLRRRLNSAAEDEFPLLAEFTAAGMTDYVAIVSRFAPQAVLGELDACTRHGQRACPTGSATTKSPRFGVSSHISLSPSNRCRSRA